MSQVIKPLLAVPVSYMGVRSSSGCFTLGPCTHVRDFLLLLVNQWIHDTSLSAFQNKFFKIKKMCIIKKTEHGFQNIFASKWTSFNCTCHEVFQVPSQKWMVHLQEAGNMCSVGSRPHQPYISLPLLAWSLELLNLAPSWVPHTHFGSHSELLGCIDQGS